MAFTPDEKKVLSLRPLQLIPWWVAVFGLVTVAGAVVVTTLWLFTVAGHSASLRIEAIKVGLSVGAGIAAGIALLLAFRRQWLNERAQAHAENTARDNIYDATQRRITELYAKAVEQLGHDKAPVRLGGLYSLERLAQDQPEHRQAVVDVVCAYLRMPFKPLTEQIIAGAPPSSDREAAARLYNEVLDTGDAGGDGDIDKEFHVRIAAQNLLARHFAASRYSHRDAEGFPQEYWPNLGIDLTGAILINLDFIACRLDYADFRRARFLGGAMFNSSEFLGHIRFEHAVFIGHASFYDVIFYSYSGFSEAEFSQPPDFRRAQAVYPNRRIWPAGWSVKQFGPDEKMGQVVKDGTEPLDDRIVLMQSTWGNALMTQKQWEHEGHRDL
jgi:hypothetical protein